MRFEAAWCEVLVSSKIDRLIADAESRTRTYDTPEELVQALKDSNRYYRANALASLLTKGDPLPVDYLPAVKSQLQEMNVRLRSTALFLLTRLGDDKQVDQDPNSLDVLLSAGSTDYDLDDRQIEFVMAIFFIA